MMSSNNNVSRYNRRTRTHGSYGAAPSSSAGTGVDAVDEAAVRTPPTSSSPWKDLRKISSAPRELWVVFALTFFVCYSLFSFSVVLTLFLTRDFGMSDMDAGWTYGFHGLMVTVAGFACGWLIDYLGVRSSLLLGAAVALVSRLIISFTTSRILAVVITVTLLPFSEALGAPILAIAIKRYTNSSTETVAFALSYTFVNIAALLAGPVVDICRFSYRDGVLVPSFMSGPLASVGAVVSLSPLRIVVLSTTISTVLLWVVTYFGIRDIELNEDGNVMDFEIDRTSGLANRTWAVLREPSFWRLTALSMIIVGARTVFRHNEATLPKYLIRKFGKDAPFGLIYAINPFVIVILVPLVGALSTKYDSFDMIMYGSIASGLSPFLIVLSESYAGVIAYMTIQSMGEAIYSPRTVEYAMKLSERGREGLYSSLSHAPMFGVQLLVGSMSGWLLTDFMPVHGPHHGKTLWGIIGAVSSSTPVLLCIAQGFLRVREPERRKNNPCPASPAIGDGR